MHQPAAATAAAFTQSMYSHTDGSSTGVGSAPQFRIEFSARNQAGMVSPSASVVAGSIAPSPSSQQIIRQAAPPAHTPTSAVPSSSRVIAIPTHQLAQPAVLSNIFVSNTGEQFIEQAPRPHGYYERVRQEDHQKGLVLKAALEMQRIAGQSGLRHVEIFCVGMYYNCIGVGFMQPVRLEDLLALHYDINSNSDARNHGVLEAFINPCVPVKAMFNHRTWITKPGDPTHFPGLVINVPTTQFLANTSTVDLDLANAATSGEAKARMTSEDIAVLQRMFPDRVDPMSQSLIVRTDAAARAMSMHYNVYKSPYESASQIECQLDQSIKTPRGQLLPRGTLRLLSANDVQEMTTGNWKSPVPSGSEHASEFPPHATEQLDKMLKYMKCIHSSPSTPPTAWDVPARLRVTNPEKTSSGTLLRYKCIASGFSERVTLADLVRLYMCARDRIVDIYYDFTIEKPDRERAPGGLVVELTVDAVPAPPIAVQVLYPSAFETAPPPEPPATRKRKQTSNEPLLFIDNNNSSDDLSGSATESAIDVANATSNSNSSTRPPPPPPIITEDDDDSGPSPFKVLRMADTPTVHKYPKNAPPVARVEPDEDPSRALVIAPQTLPPSADRPTGWLASLFSFAVPFGLDVSSWFGLKQ